MKTMPSQAGKHRLRAALAFAAAAAVCLLLATSCHKRHKAGAGEGADKPGAPSLTFTRAWGTDFSSGGNLSGPAAVVRLDNGNLLVLDRFNSRIQQYGADGAYIGKWGRAPGGGPFPFNALVDMTLDKSDGSVVVGVVNRVTSQDASRTCGGIFRADTFLTFSQDGKFTGNPAVISELNSSLARQPEFLARFDDDFWKRNEEVLCLSLYGRIASVRKTTDFGLEVDDSPLRLVPPSGEAPRDTGLKIPLEDRGRFCEIETGPDGSVYLLGCLLQLDVYKTSLFALAVGHEYIDTFIPAPVKHIVELNADTRHNLFKHDPRGGFALYDVKGNRFFLYDDGGARRGVVNVKARIFYAADFTFDGAGGFFIADYVLDEVLHVGADGEVLRRIGTDHTAPGNFAGHSFALFRTDPFKSVGERPAGIVGVTADAAGNVYAADAHNGRVQKFTSAGKFIAAFPVCGGKSPCFPSDVVYGNGAVYVSLYGAHTVLKLDPAGGAILAEWTLDKPSPTAECSLCGMGLGPGGAIFVTDGESFYKLDAALNPDPAWHRDALSIPPIKYPNDIAVDAAGNFYVAGMNLPGLLAVTETNSAVCSFSPAAKPIRCFQFGDTLYQPRSIVVAGDKVFISSSGRDSVIETLLDGTPVEVWGGEGRAPGKFQNPLGLAFDGKTYLYVADNGNERIQQFKINAK